MSKWWDFNFMLKIWVYGHVLANQIIFRVSSSSSKVSHEINRKLKCHWGFFMENEVKVISCFSYSKSVVFLIHLWELQKDGEQIFCFSSCIFYISRNRNPSLQNVSMTSGQCSKTETILWFSRWCHISLLFNF